MTTTVKNIESFPYPIIQTTDRLPTYEFLSEQLAKLASNTAYMEKNLGGADLGFLVLVIMTTMYATLLNTTFAAPVNMGTHMHILVNTTGIEQTSIHYKFSVDTKLYHLYLKVYKALNQ